MPIPKTRSELLELVISSYGKLHADLLTVDAATAEQECDGDWTIRQLMAVRVWWTTAVADWIEAGQRGEEPDLPAPGYGWKETPRLNASVIAAAADTSFSSLLAELARGSERILSLIATLDDRELLEPETFSWAGKWPVSRWVSVNTATQYVSARTMVRRVLKAQR